METAAGLIGTLGGLLWVVAIVLALFWPIMAFSSMRSLKRISKELAAINETLQSRLSLDR